MNELRTFTIQSRVGYWSVTTDETQLHAIDYLGETLHLEKQCAPQTPLEHELFETLALYFSGKKVDFKNIPVAYPDDIVYGKLTPIVMKELTKIPYGEVHSHQWLAERLGNPNASRAVGGALGRNPIPIIVPCHRIVAKSQRLGGFMQNCPEGPGIKQFLLELEGHRFEGTKLVAKCEPLSV